MTVAQHLCETNNEIIPSVTYASNFEVFNLRITAFNTTDYLQELSM